MLDFERHHNSPKLARLFAISGITVLTVLALSPNIAWFWEGAGAIALVSGFAFQGLLLLAVFAVLYKRLWLACLILAPFAALAPLEDYYVLAYRHPSNAQILASVFATNPDETIEYFGSGIFLLGTCMLAGLILALLAAYFSWRSGLHWRHRSRTWVCLAMIVLPLVGLLMAASRRPGGIAARSESVMGLASELRPHFIVGFPFGLIARALDYRDQWQSMVADIAQTSNFRFHASGSPTPGRKIYVLVLGESSRRDHWHIFGYNRNTNPELSGAQNIVPISDMITSWPYSIGAIPLALTRKPITSTQLAWDEASIVRAMEEAGFETWWLSNQMALGRYDSPISIYALEAQHTVFLNRASFSTGGSYDEALLAPLQNALSHTTGNLFIVLHLMGSHLRYDARYPTEFKRYRPTTDDADESVVPGEKMRNSYDNSIVYTDYVLARIIGKLKETDAISALFFESDHGETLPSPTCSVAGHGIGSRQDFEIPALFWYSDAYAAAYPRHVADIRANAASRTLSANTFESLADMAGIEFPGRDTSWSLFSADWRYRPRIVHSVVQINYDDAEFDKGCAVVEARSTPAAKK